MRRTVLWTLGVVVAFGAGALVGGRVGFTTTTRIVLSDALEFDAAAIRRYVDVLESMQAEQHDQAMELLESWLDDVLIVVMEPANYERPVESSAVARVDSAFMEARAYREAHPRSSARAVIDEMVANVWAAGPPGGLP